MAIRYWPVAVAMAVSVPALADDMAAKIDKVFAQWSQSTPGCAVGVAEGGKPPILRAYGMADLEHDIAITPDTIFEAGSVSKQFTAAAVALLAQDGKLSLDDPVRKYIPEVPDYGAPITIRQMLNHTSGLRDWGAVAEIGGWPRTSRVYTQAHVLDIVSRQSALNFTPGTRWSYSNTGYTLAAILVERVSGMPFTRFTSERIFQPLGMSNTSWRDDYTRIVRHRALAYEFMGGYRLLMPFENTIGHGGLLTTVGDLLKWNANFDQAAVGGQALMNEMQTRGRFNDGKPHDYALGLTVGAVRGVPLVNHTGSTAGYRAVLNRYPAQKLSVAVLCNTGNATAPAYGASVAALYLQSRFVKPAAPAAYRGFAASALDGREGEYYDSTLGRAIRLRREADALRWENGPLFVASGAEELSDPDGRTLRFGPDGSFRFIDKFGQASTLQRAVNSVDASVLAEAEGRYVSADAQAQWTLEVRNGRLIARNGPGINVPLAPAYKDTFAAPGVLVALRRGEAGKIIGLTVITDRVWHMQFDRA
jgi:CubicO group peptidase (beta-lactamase class C family)